MPYMLFSALCFPCQRRAVGTFMLSAKDASGGIPARYSSVRAGYQITLAVAEEALVIVSIGKESELALVTVLIQAGWQQG